MLMTQVFKEASARHHSASHLRRRSELQRRSETYQKLDDEGLLPVRMTVCSDEMFELLCSRKRRTIRTAKCTGRLKSSPTVCRALCSSHGAVQRRSDDKGHLGHRAGRPERTDLQRFISGLQPATHYQTAFGSDDLRSTHAGSLPGNTIERISRADCRSASSTYNCAEDQLKDSRNCRSSSIFNRCS